MERIHVVGAGPRTGTTLLAECMIGCFEIDAYETHEASLGRHKRNAKIYLTKNPVDLHLVGPRLLVDRHFHVVAMLRDPRDVIVSKHNLDPNQYWAPLRFWKRHTQVIRRLKHHSRFILVRYETLVQAPDAVQDYLMSRMPFLKRKAHFSEFHQFARPSAKAVRAMGSLRPMDASTIGNWRNHLPRVAGQISIHGPICQALIEFGYEQNDHWLVELEGVSPDLSPSHWPEEAAPKIWRFWYRKYIEAAKILLARGVGIPLV